jgi:hypothetical protein
VVKGGGGNWGFGLLANSKEAPHFASSKLYAGDCPHHLIQQLKDVNKPLSFESLLLITDHLFLLLR